MRWAVLTGLVIIFAFVAAAMLGREDGKEEEKDDDSTD